MKKQLNELFITICYKSVQITEMTSDRNKPIVFDYKAESEQKAIELASEMRNFIQKTTQRPVSLLNFTSATEEK